MATPTEAPSRVKKLLSSFLSTVNQSATENQNLRLGRLEASGDVRIIEDKPVPDARNKRLFFERVDTFTPLTWFAKPLDLSPLVCARYGWENVEYDMLQCVNCKAFLCGQLPKAVDTQVYRESCNKLKTNLTESHQKLCKWSSNPSPESFLRIPLHDREEVMSNFWFRVTLLLSTTIPVISFSSMEEKGITKEDMCGYAETIRRTGEGQRNTALDVIVCALCGWTYSESQANILHCDLCRRKIGLWNYHNENIDEDNLSKKQVSHTDQSENENISEETEINNPSIMKHNGINDKDIQNTEISEKVDHTNGNSVECNINTENNGLKDCELKATQQTESPEEPKRKRPRLEKLSFDPVAEHRYWCPWLQTESLNHEHVQRQESSPNVSPVKASTGLLQSSPRNKSSENREPVWVLVTKILSCTSEDDFLRQMKQSPQVEGLRHLRKMLKQCTSSTSPTKKSE